MEIDYSSFMQKGEDGSIVSFDESKLSSYLDSLVSKGVNNGVETYKAKIAKEQEMAKLNDQEKLSKQMEEFEATKKAWEETVKTQKREIVVEKSKAKLADKFSEAEVNLLLQNVTDDEKTSLKYIDELVAERDKFLNETKTKLIEELQSKQPRTSSQPNAENGSGNQKPVKKTAQDIKNLYK